MQPPSERGDARWEAKPRLAALLRLAATLGPIAIGAFVVTLISHGVPRPSGWLLNVVWWVGLAVVSTAVVTVAERVLRRFMPLVALFRLSLVFPDNAPSRFKVALRTNTLRQLQRSLAEGDVTGFSPGLQESAELLLGLAGDLNAHDRMTRGHTERVRAYTLMIGEELGLPPADLDKLHWAGLIHDIGKLEVPPAILNKAGRPSEEEWQILRNHPAAGLRLVEPLRPWLGEWADAASQHHERVDGKGYPFGLSGSQISLSGRIVAVADAYDVMTSVRSYKKAMAPEAARAELGRCAGTQFDRDVVRAFLNISVGKLRLVAGPLSSLAHLPRLADLPLGGAVAAGLSGAASIGLAVVSGFVGVADVPPSEMAFAAPQAEASAPSVPAGSRRSGPDITIPVVTIPDTTIPDVPSAEPTALAGGGADDAAEPVDDDVDAPNPVATRLRLSGIEDTVIVVDAGRVLDPPPTSWRVVDAPAELTVSTVGSRTTLTPASNHHGTSTGRYEACWDDRCSEAPLVVTITAVNDAPTGVADVVAATTGIPMTVNVLANDTDVEGDELTVVAVGVPTIGTATSDGRRVTYTAPIGAAGDARFSYTAADPSGAVSTTEVTVRLVAALPPNAVGDAATVAEDSVPAFLDVIDNDVAGTSDLAGATIRVVTGPSLGTAAVAGHQVVYQPTADVNGSDALDYEVCDALGLCDTSTLQIDVVAVNDRPTFAPSGGRTVVEDAGPTTATNWATSISPGPADEAAQDVSFEVTPDRPELFAVPPAIDQSGNLTFEPAADANGVVNIRVTARDDGGTMLGGVDTGSPMTFALTITPANDPVVGTGDTITLAEDDPAVSVDVLTNDLDVDGDPLTVTSIDTSLLVGGTVTDLGSGRLAFAPAADFHGTETFTYVVDDGNGTTDTVSVTVTVTAVPDAPQARRDGYRTNRDTSLSPVATGLLANDADADMDALTVSTTPLSAPTHGTVVLATDGTFTYTPAAGYVGADAFTYEIDDGTGRRAAAVADIVVDSGVVTTGFYLGTTPNGSLWNLRSTPLPAGDPEPDHDADGAPGFTVLQSDNNPADLTPTTNVGFVHQVTGTTLRLNGPVTLDLWSTVDDFEASRAAHPLVTLHDCTGTGPSCTQLATGDVVGGPYNGHVSDWVSKRVTFGNLTHDIADGHSLVVRVQVRLEDLWLAASGSRPSRLNITEANVAPSAADDGPAAVTEDDPAVNLDVLANDVDTNLDSTSVTVVVAPTSGTAVPRSDGSIDYTPTPDANGPDSFDYQVCDTSGLCDTATVDVAIQAINDAPTFTGNGDVVALLGAAHSSAWATGSPGPPDETSQALSYTVTTDNPGLFTVQPAISPAGVLTFQCGLLAIGTANVTVTVQDTGGSVGGGIDTSTSQTFVVTAV